uniref:Putative secreted peptide n=1 Tax=Anopheles braziliensis TaxID=58242 RepID=A0A2M3ZTF9_9DIPT
MDTSFAPFSIYLATFASYCLLAYVCATNPAKKLTFKRWLNVIFATDCRTRTHTEPRGTRRRVRLATVHAATERRVHTTKNSTKRERG